MQGVHESCGGCSHALPALSVGLRFVLLEVQVKQVSLLVRTLLAHMGQQPAFRAAWATTACLAC